MTNGRGYYIIDPLSMRSWRNWQTRKTKDLGANTMQVQFLSTAPEYKGFRFRFFLLMKPGRLWLVCPVEGGKEIEISVKMRRWCRKKRCSKMRSSHKYIFYFYPTWRENERGKIEEIKGFFRFFERVKDGKAAAARMGRKYDHQKIF